MKKKFSVSTHFTAVLLLFFLSLLTGCALFTGSLQQSQDYMREQKYEEAVERLDEVIESDASEEEKAHAFLLRSEAYTALKEYRYAYRDLQVAWKLSCHLYQTLPLRQKNATLSKDSFNTTTACIEKIPLLLDELKPYTSDFGAIMATQEASSIFKKMFPNLPR